MIDSLYNHLTAALRGVGQIVFQNDALAGALLLAGVAIGSPSCAALAAAGSLAATLVARLFRYPAAEISRGLYGFNGALVGIAAALFLRLTPVSLLLAGAGIVATLPMMRLAMRRGIPAFTAPFVLVGWLLLCVAAYCPSLAATAVSAAPEFGDGMIFARSFAQILLQTSPWTGFFLAAGIAVGSWRDFRYGAWGGLLALAPVLLALLPQEDAAAGLYGYNAVLSAIAAGHVAPHRFARATAAALLSVGLQAAALAAGIPPLTAPFVLSVWAVMSVGRKNATESR